MSDKILRRLFGYALRSGVEYQDGRASKAPSLVFADADYEVGDGSCGLKEDGKQCNEPVIAYARTDALIDAHTRIRELEAELAALREVRALTNELLTLLSRLGPIGPSHCRYHNKWYRVDDVVNDLRAALEPAPVTVAQLDEVNEKLTYDELGAVFGERMPIQVAAVLADNKGYASPLDARKAVNAALRALADAGETKE